MKFSGKALIGIFSVLAITFGAAGCGDVKVGYVNQERITEECPQIKASVDEWQAKLDELQNTAIKELSDMSAAGASEEEIGKKQQEYQMKAATMNQQFQAQTRAKVDAAIDEVARAKELDTVLKSSTANKAVLVGGVDITDDIIQKLQ